MTADSPPPRTPNPGERQRRWIHPAAPPALLTVLVALLGILLSAPEGRAQDHAADRAALVALYNATGGFNWRKSRNWLSDEPLGEWYGVTVQNGRVTDLILSRNNLTGSIPSELGDLASLRELDLHYNRLIGSIPSELGKLSDLERLHLLTNRLTGPIPPELGNLAKLEQLSLSQNQLTGSIPSDLGNLPLVLLGLDHNRLTGVIPSELGDIAKLYILSLNHNQLTGPIPLSFANLVELDWFRFHVNPGLCAGPAAVIRNWLDSVGHVAGPDCSPSITLSVSPSNLVEGRFTAVRVTASQTPVSEPTRVGLLFGGTATSGEAKDYTLDSRSGSFTAIHDALTIPPNRASGTNVLTFYPWADSLIEGTENIILQPYVVQSSVPGRPILYGSEVGGWAVLTLNDQRGCAARDRAALESLYHVTGGTTWTHSRRHPEYGIRG